jgi:hypothetical protein
MDRKHNGHAWCKVKTTNIKNDFGLGFCSDKCMATFDVKTIIMLNLFVSVSEMKSLG